MTLKDFRLPDLGEGLTESEIASWKVAEGDTVSVNQIIAEVETAKALVELPSPFAGVIHTLYADEGATVQVGEPIIAFELEGEGDVSGKASGGERETVLVGWGPKKEAGTKPTRRRRAWSVDEEPRRSDSSAAPSSSASGEPQSVDAVSEETDASRDAPDDESRGPARPERPRTTPPVRIFARELGVDLTAVQGTGADGLITREDVQRAVDGGAGMPEEAAPQSSGESREVRTPIRGVRKATAAAMVESAFSAPHASEFITIDVTRTVELVARMREQHPDVRITIMTIVAKAMLLAAARTPSVNARWDEKSNEIVEFRYVNLGIAAATDRGLVVPIIRDADSRTFLDLAHAIAELVGTAREGRTSPADLSGGTLTLTNVGVFGVDAGTPILTPGQSAILAAGAVRRRPWEHDGEVALREVMTLSMSFDHRLVDGEQASRFLVDVARVLEDPGTVLALV